MTQSSKLSINSLPLPSALVTDHLTPDPHTPDLITFRNVQRTKASIQRRARLLSPEAHYSRVSPFPTSFPYEIPAPEDPRTAPGGSYIEEWLARREPTQALASNTALRIHYPEVRENQSRVLIGISETGLRDCLPHLDIGDAFSVVGEPSLTRTTEGDVQGQESSTASATRARNELVDVLSGYGSLMTAEDAPEDTAQFGPFSYRYSGHQFGDWAGQLGDGRAITVLVAAHPTKEMSYELQLKGSGRTPFSRSADGLAVVRSSIREYLCSEAMQALGIPTSRSLSLVHLAETHVARETLERACVLTRAAESFIRIGSFEAFNPPTQMYFFGGGQQKPHYDGLRTLGEWVSKHVLKVVDVNSDEAWASKLVLDCAERNARMVAGWQAYGFCHGVINTDNVSIMGLTIDYGPYAFMDKFDRHHICNHTDVGGRYSYKLQPSMIQFALRALLNSLAPLIGAEAESRRAVSSGWAEGKSDEEIDDWAQKGLELKDELDRVVQETCSIEYGRLMGKRLGLARQETSDEREFFKPLLDILEEFELDFHGPFRTLCGFDVADDQDVLIARLMEGCVRPDRVDKARASESWSNWLGKYSARIKSELDAGEWIDSVERQRVMRNANPRFVLRQWVLQETIEKVEKDPQNGKHFLSKVMHMASYPFEPWGGEGESEAELDKEALEEARLCSLGPSSMLGFQCSCSS